MCFNYFCSKETLMIHAPLFYLQETDSSNKELWRMIEAATELPPEGTVVQAGMQTAGRGQGSTVWLGEPNKNLLFSVLLKPTFLPPAAQFMLNKCIALAIRDALSVLCKQQPFTIKWPNDIYCKGGKIAGTLIENRIMGKTCELTVAGIGININQSLFPPDIPHATSLKLLTASDHDIDQCRQEVVKYIDTYYCALKKGNYKEISDVYLQHLLGYNKLLKFMINGMVTQARINGVDPYGKLLLTTNEGVTHACGNKEITFLF